MKTACSPSKVLTAVTALMQLGSLVGCDAAANALEIMESAPGVAAGAPDNPDSAGDAAKALIQLENIPVKGRAPKTGYTRDEFGPAWADIDCNGCDTRNDILARDLINETFKPGTNNCVVTAGTLADKYTGRKQLANDPMNLMAADGTTNSAKGDKDAATWLPPNKVFRCEYVARQTAVKAKYSLWVTRAEHDAMIGILVGCK